MKALLDWLKGRVLLLLYAGCALSLLLEVVFRVVGHSYDHLHFHHEEFFAFHAGWGFLTFALLVASAHALGALTRRDEDYYGDRPGDPTGDEPAGDRMTGEAAAVHKKEPGDA